MRLNKIKGFLFKQVYAALRFSRDKNKAVILDIDWDCGILGVIDGNLKSDRDAKHPVIMIS